MSSHELHSEQCHACPVVSANQIAITTSAAASRRRTVRRFSGVEIFDCSVPASVTMPLWMTIVGRLTGERVTLREMVGVGLGFIGVYGVSFLTAL